MYIIDCTIQGSLPLLMNRFPMPGEPEVATRHSGVKENVEDWEKDYEKSKYQTEKGELFTPSTHIHRAMEIAALNFKIKGRGRKTYRDIVRAACEVSPDAIIHKIQDVSPDRRWVRVQTARVPRVRACLPAGWTLEFILTILDDQLPFSAVKDILDYAGRLVGIGDYRPYFGKFLVTHFQKQEEEEKKKK